MEDPAAVQGHARGDFKTVTAGGKQALVELGLATLADTTTEEFAEIVKNWLTTATHPRFQRRYLELVYQGFRSRILLVQSTSIGHWGCTGRR